MVFKYQHADPVSAGWVWLAWWTILALVAASTFFLGPLGVVLTIVVVILMIKRVRRRSIYLGDRYFVCGNTIAYYRNIKRMELRPGHLSLHWGEKGTFRLEQDRFPTNARKAEKIAKNKAAKFEKVSQRIVRKVLVDSPSVELAGIQRDGKLVGKKR